MSEETANCSSPNPNPNHQDGLGLGPHSETITQIKELSGEKLFCRILLLLSVLLQPHYSWRSRYCLVPDTKPNLHCTFNHKPTLGCAFSHGVRPQAMVEIIKKYYRINVFVAYPFLWQPDPIHPRSTQSPKICVSPNSLPNFNANPNGEYRLSFS